MARAEEITRIVDWQRRYRARPVVWAVMYTSGGFAGTLTGNFYDSKEAAEAEVAWLARRGERSRAYSEPIHTLDLSRERWPADGRVTGMLRGVGNVDAALDAKTDGGSKP